MKFRHLLVTIAILLIVVAIFGGAMAALNLYTGPIIADNNASAGNKDFIDVMPNGKNFEEMNIAELGLPSSIIAVYKETNGNGHIFKASAKGYADGLVVLCGIDSNGAITGSKVVESNETWGKENSLNGAYNGKTLEDATLILYAGATEKSETSKGYFAAIEASLQANVIVGGGALSPDVALKNLIPTVAPEFKELQELETVSGNIVKVFKPANEIGFAYVMSEGDAYYLVIANAMGVCKVYNEEGTDVTSDHDALVTEAQTHVFANQTNFVEALIAEVEKFDASATDITTITLDSFGNVAAAVSFKIGDVTYYGFQPRIYGYKNNVTEVFIIIDETGAIAKVRATQYVFLEEFFHGFAGVPNGYANGFAGFTEDTWTGDNATISGATITSDAMRQAVAEAFAAFNSIKGGEQ